MDGVAAVDVGSNAIRFMAAEFSSLSEYQVLVEQRVPVRLGHDVFLTGRLTPEALQLAAGDTVVEQCELGLRRTRPLADRDDLAQVRQLQPVEALHETVVRDHHACLGGVDDVGEHVAAVSRVERHEHRAEVIGGEPGEHHRAPGEPVGRGRAGP